MFGFLGLACAALLVYIIITVLFGQISFIYTILTSINLVYFLLLIWLLWGSMGQRGFSSCFQFYFNIIYYGFRDLILPYL